MPTYKLVVTFQVEAEDEAEVVRRFSADKAALKDAWLNRVERIEVDEL